MRSEGQLASRRVIEPELREYSARAFLCALE
jgi:hypothetical protein